MKSASLTDDSFQAPSFAKCQKPQSETAGQAQKLPVDGTKMSVPPHRFC